MSGTGVCSGESGNKGFFSRLTPRHSKKEIEAALAQAEVLDWFQTHQRRKVDDALRIRHFDDVLVS